MTVRKVSFARSDSEGAEASPSPEAQVNFQLAQPGGNTAGIDDLIVDFVKTFQPLEQGDKLWLFVDNLNGARYCECHIRASALLKNSTTDVPLDPEDQAEYRANRDLLVDDSAFEKMTEDANGGRAFSNIVAEFTRDFGSETPLKIIGGQHRIEAIKTAVASSRDEWHGIKVYFKLDTEQRLDAQLISNTNIAVSQDLLDRMQETVSGPELRNWCQAVGFLEKNKDFAAKRERGKSITVKIARVFIWNYFMGKEASKGEFASTQTTPELSISNESWEKLKRDNPKLWEDKKLAEAASAFASLIAAQRKFFEGKKINADYAEKALNYAIVSAWAYVAGLLYQNEVRRKRHFQFAAPAGKDPLNAIALAKGRHKTDIESYRGLGYRTDPKERGRFVELFFAQAEDGKGITSSLIELAISAYHAKVANLDVIRVREKAKNG